MTDQTKPQEEPQDDRQMVITPKDLFDLDDLARDVRQMAADRIVSQTKDGVLKDIQVRIGVAIENQVSAVIQEAIAKRRQPTDWMGNPKGEVTTLEEEIMKRIDKLLEKEVDPESGKEPRDYRSKRVPMMTYLCRRTMDSAIEIAILRAAESVCLKISDQIPTEYIAEELKRLHQNALESKARQEAEEDEDE